MSDFKSRLLIEKSDLSEKIQKLSSFIGGNNFKSIDPKQQDLLSKQLPVMKAYEGILSERLSLLD
jgi:hypothetical protein